MKLKFLRFESVSNGVSSFLFEPENPVIWQPGQYMHYVLPHPDADDRGTERWFTNSAAPSEGHIMISTRVDAVTVSSFKQALQKLNPGDEIEADGPEGEFIIDDKSRNYLFVAGGIGITPFRSILVDSHKNGIRLNVTLLYANRSQDIPFKEELEQIAADNPNFKINYVIQPDRIDNNLLKKYINAIENPYVYISGPEPMVTDFAKQLSDLGVQNENIKTDDFPGYEVI